MLHRGQPLRQVLRQLLALFLVGIGLLLLDTAFYQIGLPVTILATSSTTTLRIGSQQFVLPPSLPPPVRLTLPAGDPVVHEYQIDGTDSTNNFTLDFPYLNFLATTPYYRLNAWMRNLAGTSSWNNLHIIDGTKITQIPVSTETPITLPNAEEHSFQVSMTLARPETPTTFILGLLDGSEIHVTLDRNDRSIAISYLSVDGGSQRLLTRSFFPYDIAPFAAMVADTIIRTLLGSLFLIVIVILGDSFVAGLLLLFAIPIGAVAASWQQLLRQRPTMLQWIPTVTLPLRREYTTVLAWFQRFWYRLTTAIHPVAILGLFCSFIFVCWISLVQYNAQPHIYDASAYLFGAKMYAHGSLAVPIPAAADRFPGPFMLDYNGQRFTQYIPGTSLTLMIGILLHAPWIIEPILGTLALLGIGLLAYQLFQRRTVATIAILLGCVSPFYSYLAASYMSHAIALFYLVWGCWFLFRFAEGKRGVNVIAAALLWGMAWLTRDQISLLFMGIMIIGVFVLYWQTIRQQLVHWLFWASVGVSIGFMYWCMLVLFNHALTDDFFLSPRTLYSPNDHLGFGDQIGFYGMHTVAAGFVTLDELLTSLLITLFGWPFVFTLSFLILPFIRHRRHRADWFLLVGATTMIGIFIGFYYHGIYLGPRYLFESLPFLLILSARGIESLWELGSAVGIWLYSTFSQMKVKEAPESFGSGTTVVVLALLLTCSFFYYFPRQVVLHTNFTGLSATTNINLQQIYHPDMRQMGGQPAIVITNNFSIYEYVLFPLNDPQLHDRVIYALAGNAQDYNELRLAYPQRTLYELVVTPDGSVSYLQI